MFCKWHLSNEVLITVSVFFGAIALTLACIGIGTPYWQTISLTLASGETFIASSANFFYACRYDLAGDVISCVDRSSNSSIGQYYGIIATGNESEWNFHLNTAAGFSIIGIIFIFFGTTATSFMFFGNRGEWIYFVAPSFLFVACLFMLAGLAEGARILLYNGYSVNLYETAHVITIFSFLISALVGGRLFDPPRKPQRSTKIKQVK